MAPSTGGASSSSSSSAAPIHRIDKPLVMALSLMFLTYWVVTFVAYHKVSTRATLTPGSAALQVDETILNQPKNVYIHKTPTTIRELQHTFPIHVGADVERIVHPGLAIVNLVDKFGNTPVEGKTAKRVIPKDLPRTMTVPKFFDDSHGHIYHNGKHCDDCTVRHYLGDGDTLMTPEIAATIGSWYTDPETGEELETIYCSIASYRDPECRGSVEDVFARAEHPERVRVAVIDQRVLGDEDPKCDIPIEPCEQNPNQALCKYRYLIDYYEVDARLSIGPVFARHMANRMYRGEYYAMQIDAHVRFTQDWDSDIIGQFKSAKNEMAVLSSYPSDLTDSIDPVTHKNIRGLRPIMCASDYEGEGHFKHLRHGQQPEGKPGIVGQPTLHPYWGAGFSFGRGHFVLQVPYDQYLPMVFQGEEISIGLRGFTYGYDYYAPERGVCFHMYAKFNEERKKVPHFWENSNLYQGTGIRAMRRLNSILGMTGLQKFSDADWDHPEIHRYGLGNVRKAQKFFDVFGIHVEIEKTEHHLCRFVGKPMMNVFMPALRANKMGLDYDLINYQWKDPAPDEPDLRANPPRDAE